MSSPKALLVLGAGALIGLCVAVPSLLGAFGEADPNDHPVDPVPYVPPTPAAPVAPTAEQAAARHTMRIEEEADAPATPTLETSADGDLEAAIKLRFSKVETGDRVLATVKLGNRSQRDFWLPAAGEPNPGLAVIVQDAEGTEVRRVVETTKNGQLPRRVTKLAAGFEFETPVVVVAEDEAPLPPGTYTAYVELRPDARLPRLGLPAWASPKGPVRSDTVTLVVAAKTN